MRRCTPNNPCNHVQYGLANPFFVGYGFDISPFMDLLNLQSDNVNNFVNVSGAISQWTDISPALNHATQPTSGLRPLYNSGEPKWDGSGSFLALTNEIGLSTFSLYIVFKRRVVNSADLAILSSDGPGNNFFRLDGSNATIARQMTLNNVDRPPTANFTSSWRIGGEESYQVMSFRRSNGTIVVKLNDRTAITISIGANPTWLSYIKYIGSTNSSLYFDGNIRAICMSSQNISDTIDNSIRETLYSKYALLTASVPKIICLGDSITAGGAVATSFPSYIDPLGTAMGMPYVNLGIAGEQATGGLARYASQIITRPYTDKVYIMFGANDINAGVPTATFAATISSIAQGLITAGYSPRNICLSSPCYQQSGANASTLDAYAAAVLSKASSLGTRYADILTYIRNNGADTLMGDGLHPNSSGNAAIATVVNIAFQGA